MLHAVGASRELDHVAAVEEPVEQGGREHLVVKYLHPFGRCLVGGDDHRRLLVQRVDEVEERHALLLLHGHEHDVVYAEQVELEYPVVGAHGGRRHVLHAQYAHERLHGHELRLVALEYGVAYQPSGHVGLAGSAGSHEDDVVHLVEPYELAQLPELRLRDAGAVVEVEAVEVALPGEPGLLHAPLQVASLPFLHLGGQDAVYELLVGGLVHLGPVDGVRAVLGEAAQPQEPG